MPRFFLAVFALPLAAAASVSTAQNRSDSLAEQWREAKRAELLNDLSAAQAQLAARRAAIAAALKQLDKGATPDTFDPGPSPPVSASQIVTTTQTKLATSADGSSQKIVTTTSTSDESAPALKPKGTAADASETPGRRPFGGLDFGIGVSYTGDVGRNDRIGTATLDSNGVVRITDKNNANARIMLESHYFFTPNKSFLFGPKNFADKRDDYGNIIVPGQKTWGIGPFIALRPGSDDVIDAIGMGLMLGFRRGADSKESFNFGMGVVVDPNVRVLGEGIRADARLPDGETEIRYRETSQLGYLLLTSFSF